MRAQLRNAARACGWTGSPRPRGSCRVRELPRAGGACGEGAGECAREDREPQCCQHPECSRGALGYWRGTLRYSTVLYGTRGASQPIGAASSADAKALTTRPERIVHSSLRYISIYVYVYIYIYRCMYVCMHACMYTYIHTCMHAYIHTSMCVCERERESV